MSLLNSHISRGSVAKHLMCDVIISFIANLLHSVPANNLENSQYLINLLNLVTDDVIRLSVNR